MSTIKWTCHTCRRAVAPRAGYLHIDKSRVNERQRSYEEGARARAAEAEHSGVQTWRATDLLAAADPVPWQVHHAGCDPEPDRIDYCIPLDRAQTHAQLLDWTAHLMGKRWIDVTNWADLIRRVAGVDA